MALRGGAVTGLVVVALSLLGVGSLFLFFGGLQNPQAVPYQLVGFGFGASLVALFAQLGGGIYTKAADYARTRGIISADTKFEFGITSKGITLADEVLTPDSSRFWPADKYQPGRAQDSYDKQYVRDYLEEIRWNKQPPAPALPPEVARKTSEKYVEAYHQLTGRELDV